MRSPAGPAIASSSSSPSSQANTRAAPAPLPRAAQPPTVSAGSHSGPPTTPTRRPRRLGGHLRRGAGRGSKGAAGGGGLRGGRGKGDDRIPYDPAKKGCLTGLLVRQKLHFYLQRAGITLNKDVSSFTSDGGGDMAKCAELCVLEDAIIPHACRAHNLHLPQSCSFSQNCSTGFTELFNS